MILLAANDENVNGAEIMVGTVIVRVQCVRWIVSGYTDAVGGYSREV